MNLQSRELRLNSQGEDVAMLHNQLLSMGGSIDAAELAMKLFGDTTRRRVLEFQERTALPPTGVVDEDTANAIDRAAEGVGGVEGRDPFRHRVSPDSSRSSGMTSGWDGPSVGRPCAAASESCSSAAIR